MNAGAAVRTKQGVRTATGVLIRAELGARVGSRWALLDTAAAEEHNREVLFRRKVLHPNRTPDFDVNHMTLALPRTLTFTLPACTTSFNALSQ